MLIIHRPPSPDDLAAAVLAAMQDERLSLRARGLLGLLLSHPDEEWPHQTMADLAKVLSARQRALTGRARGEGRDAMRDLLNELEKAGYLVRRRGGSRSRPQLFIEIFHTPADVERIPMPDGDGAAEVYLVGSFGSSIAKIGTSGSLQRRLSNLQTGYPLKLEILWHRPGGWALEDYLKTYFKDRKLEGEWFDFGEEDPMEAVLRAVAKKYPEEFPDWPVSQQR
ncbi:GIY-YIG nuclease family protein [Streptomyces sp. NBC_00006]|uniref:GIY-YIG nuclease family protein n=1 Tax=Streptomyces sp. NBC_00006 TaxID=2975619 RepID=UPI00224DE44E|nr:GIY-YIG nuclease family protein [Streptomyces sp. NBC_00006]MCX5528970.1 GIY-YIG nuclease family protein [Streptomyces sp. NBC_00006]MCX5537798.1 GIY-YIG nuclease family protein [Streptomyces sp. NBC_00006]